MEVNTREETGSLKSLKKNTDVNKCCAEKKIYIYISRECDRTWRGGFGGIMTSNEVVKGKLIKKMIRQKEEEGDRMSRASICYRSISSRGNNGCKDPNIEMVLRSN